MNFKIGEAFDLGDQIENGPIVLFWGQEEQVEPRPGVSVKWPTDPGKLSWWQKRRGFRHWKILIRLQPVESENLHEWGGRIAAALGVTFSPTSPPDERDTAIWQPGIAKARNAGEALARAGQLLQHAQGFDVVALQIEVSAFSEPGAA